MDPFLQSANQKIQAALDHLKRELAAIRAGRANPSLIEELPVQAYGTRMKLVEMGSINAPQPSLLTVQVWDASLLQNVIKAIQEANLGFNPVAEGQLIRLPIPALTAERREEFIKVAHQRMEEARIEVRQIRQNTREEWQKAEEDGEISEDEFDRRSKLLQDLIDKANEQIEQLGKQKEEELGQV